MAAPRRPPGATREAIRVLLERGMRPAEIAAELGISRPTVSYHVRRLGFDGNAATGRRYDWARIRAFYEAGNSFRACQQRFGFSGAAWSAAVRRGEIVARPAGMPLEELLIGSRNRTHVRLRLISAGVKERRCERCGLDTWLDEPIPLQLHHVNGVGSDNRLENLEILCANCHALTDTWSGRNRRRRAG